MNKFEALSLHLTQSLCSCYSTPYNGFTRLITKTVIKYAIYWLNTFPSDNGVSDTLSTDAIVL